MILTSRRRTRRADAALKHWVALLALLAPGCVLNPTGELPGATTGTTMGATAGAGSVIDMSPVGGSSAGGSASFPPIEQGGSVAAGGSPDAGSGAGGTDTGGGTSFGGSRPLDGSLPLDGGVPPTDGEMPDAAP